MKVLFSFQKNNIKRPQNQTLTFEAGLTPRMLQEIRQVDTLEISKRLAEKGIPTDFKGDKFIAWGSNKTVQILQQLRDRFGQRVHFSKGIRSEYFENLKDENPLALGTCNLLRTDRIKGSDEIIPSRTVFFNLAHDWSNIDAISDEQYAARYFSTDFFLYPFLHELAHVMHEDRLLSKFGGKKLTKMLERLHGQEQLQRYREVYGDTVRQICDYADNTPLDAVACDMSRVIAGCLDKETLMPTRNPFIGTPYEELHFWQKPKYPDHKKQPLQEILRRFWNGQFE